MALLFYFIIRPEQWGKHPGCDPFAAARIVRDLKYGLLDKAALPVTEALEGVLLVQFLGVGNLTRTGLQETKMHARIVQ